MASQIPEEAAEEPLRLIVRADDAGSSMAANAGIAEAVERGIVRNISLMACGPALHDAAERLSRLSGVAFGMHATVTSEWPSPRWGPVLGKERIPSLVRADGTFWTEPQVLADHGFLLKDLQEELAAQLAALRSVGFSIAYVDTHMGFDWLPGVRDVLRQLAEENGLILDTPETHPRLPWGQPRRPLAACIREAPQGLHVVITHPLRLEEKDSGWGAMPAQEAARRDAERRELISKETFLALLAKGAILETYV